MPGLLYLTIRGQKIRSWAAQTDEQERQASNAVNGHEVAG